MTGDADLIETVEDQEQTNQFDFEDFKLHVQFGLFVVPIIMVFLALALWVATAAMRLELPRIPLGGLIFGWCWLNGPLLAAARWAWRKERWPLSPTRWIEGKKARHIALSIPAMSLLTFLSFGIIEELWKFCVWLFPNLGW